MDWEHVKAIPWDMIFIFFFFFNFQPPCKNNKTAGTFCFPTFQVLFYIEENTATQRIDIFVDFHADWLVKSVTLHHEMSQDSPVKSSRIQTNTNANKYKQIQIQMYICWLTGQEYGIASWNLTGLPSVIISYNQGGSAQSTPLVLAAAVVIKYTNSNQALHLICGNRSNVEKGFNQPETFFFSTFPSPAWFQTS